MARSCSIPKAVCPLYHQGRAETYGRPPRRCYTRAVWGRGPGDLAKTVETKPNIAFANGTIPRQEPAKGLKSDRGMPSRFRCRGPRLKRGELFFGHHLNSSGRTF